MPSPFKRTASANVGVASVDVATVPALKVWTLIDASCANVEPGKTQVLGTVRHVQSGGPTVNLIKDGPVPYGSAMVVVGAPRKVVLLAGDKIQAQADKANGMDVSLSYLEQDA